MAIVCAKYDLLFTHVPKTGGMFVEQFLLDHLGGERIGARHFTFRRLELDDVPAVRAFVIRDPLDWYRSYWAYARSMTNHRAAWPMWSGGDPAHPTRELDIRCGSATFRGFLTKVLRHFPNGFVRSMYCDFANGATHALRAEQLNDDLEGLLQLVGFEARHLVHEQPRVNVTAPRRKAETALPAGLADRVREVDNLDGLVFNYVAA
jgi:hypothetical protein